MTKDKKDELYLMIDFLEDQKTYEISGHVEMCQKIIDVLESLIKE